MAMVNIISGFLGAGKTTLIKKLLDGAFEGEKVVLLENEYGEVGIDGGFMKDTGIVSHTILLRACEMGYNGCMIGSFDKDIITEALSIPESYEITLVLAMGKGNENVEIIDNTGDIKYYRENGTHYVPKRTLEEITVE